MTKEKKVYALMLGKNSLKRELGIESGHAELTVTARCTMVTSTYIDTAIRVHRGRLEG
jgi:hypothetical protein